MNKVEVINVDKQSKKIEKLVQKLAAKILKILKQNNVSAEIYLTDSRKMRLINRKFRGRDKTTTILSFEEPRNFIYPSERGTTRTVRGQTRKIRRLGEIYLNAELCRKSQRQSAFSQRQSAYLLIHGLLHLLGYNHSQKSDRIKMEKKEKFIISNI